MSTNVPSTESVPEHVPVEWLQIPTPSLCTCPAPIPEVRAERKGAARTHCARCGLPVPIGFSKQ